VAASAGDTVKIAALGTQVSARLPPKGLAPGDAVQLIVRPEAVEIVRGDTGPLHATIVSRTFLGEKIEYVVRCEGEMLQVVRYNAGPGDLVPEGEAVSLRFAPDAVTILTEPGE
jgi:ABC-type Fe3+/spermidine/putrescine transport system ATPase subunit